MFNINKIILIAFLMMIFSSAGFSQKKEMELANSEFVDLQYHTAAETYQKALLKIKAEDTLQMQHAKFMLGECYRLMNDPDKAEPYYTGLIKSTYGDTYPVIYLRYASVLQTKGDAAGARNYYGKYLKEDPGNQQAKTGIKSCDWILANKNKRLQVNVYDIQALNSQNDDFAAVFFSHNSDRLVFTSNRPGATGKTMDQWTGSNFSDLYKSTLSGTSWNDPALFENQGVINTEIHEGTPAFNREFSTMYFTRCERMAGKKEYCKIFKTEKNGETWAAPEVVFADTSANMGQPTLSSDELKIVFSSDMKGGRGGKDLWVARRESREKNFGQPVNPGPGINTPGDEMFPYLFNDTTLYFASDGYEGYGGMDIYKSAWKANTWNAPVNLLVPINSGYDDFGVIIKIPGEEGYFSSNRPGGKGGDDIYQFTKKILLFTISGKVKDNMTLLPLEMAQVLLIGEKSDTVKMFSDGQGFFKFDTSSILEDHSYELLVRKNNYFSEKESFETKTYEDDHDFVVEIILEPIPEKPIVLPDILYALDRWDLQPQYQDSLMNLADLLFDNENIVIELRSHTDSRASYEYNDVLSQKRAQSVVDFLVNLGVDPGRLVAKGYGERIFRVLDKDMVREGYLFKAGTELNDQFINSLPTNEIKEAAFQLNRRTEFSVLSKDYKK